MKRIILFISIALTIFGSCKADYVAKVNKYAGAKKEYDFDAIKGIDNHSPITVEFFNGPQEVSLHGTTSVIENIEVKMTSDGVLHIESVAPVTINEKSYAVLMVKARDIDSFSQSGSGKILMTDKVSIPGHIKFFVSGSGNIEASSIYATSVEGTNTGSGDLQISYLRCDNLQCNLSGSGDILIDDMEGKSVNLRNTGSGDLHFEEMVCDNCEALNSGSGDTNIMSGMCETASFTSSGSGGMHVADFEVEHLSAMAAGAGYLFCNAVQSIKAHTEQRGSIRYCGSATYTGTDSNVRRFTPR